MLELFFTYTLFLYRLLCQVYFCDSNVPDLSVEGLIFSQNRRPIAGAARSRTLSMVSEGYGSTGDARRGP